MRIASKSDLGCPLQTQRHRRAGCCATSDGGEESFLSCTARHSFAKILAAGLWGHDTKQDVTSRTIIAVSAAYEIANPHIRMPVILRLVNTIRILSSDE
ncbi:MAG: hypothetical protein ABJZ69_02645 [Hyphomicrobiales bacterium]